MALLPSPPSSFSLRTNPLYIMGDLHVLSIAHQTIKTPTSLRRLIPYPITGLKAHHTTAILSSDSQFFTYDNLRTALSRLPPNTTTIILSAGEIDCREGIGRDKLQNFDHDCHDDVRLCVTRYIRSIIKLFFDDDDDKSGVEQVLLLPVAPHAYRSDKKGRSLGRRMRRRRMEVWNEALRWEVGERGKRVFLLDYVDGLRDVNNKKKVRNDDDNKDDDDDDVEFVLRKEFNADFTHMNSAFLPLLEVALENCGCDFNLL